jgi:hypothetical protein
LSGYELNVLSPPEQGIRIFFIIMDQPTNQPTTQTKTKRNQMNAMFDRDQDLSSPLPPYSTVFIMDGPDYAGVPLYEELFAAVEMSSCLREP